MSFLCKQGTTSVRTLESLYWLGVRLLHSEASPDSQIFSIDQWDPYVYLDRLGPASLPTPTEALTAVLSTQTLRGEDGREHAARDEVVCKTKLLIVPGYPFQLCVSFLAAFTSKLFSDVLTCIFYVS